MLTVVNLADDSLGTEGGWWGRTGKAGNVGKIKLNQIFCWQPPSPHATFPYAPPYPTPTPPTSNHLVATRPSSFPSGPSLLPSPGAQAISAHFSGISKPALQTAENVLELKVNPLDALETKKQLPWHSAAAVLQLRGVPSWEIAESLGVSVETLGVVRKQPWYKELLKGLRSNSDPGPLLQSMAWDCLQTLFDLAVGAQSESVKLSACKEVMDRAKGFLKLVPGSKGAKAEDEVDDLDPVALEEKLKEALQSA